MFPNFMKTVFRHLWKNKGYSALNVAGLSIGITFAALVFLWAEDELNFDSSHAKRGNVYMTYVHQDYETGVFTHKSAPGPLGPALKTDIPGIENTCRTNEGQANLLLRVGDQSLYAAGKYAEPSIFQLFTLPFVQGNAAAALSQPQSIVLTDQLAKRLFGQSYGDIIGKSVRLDNKEDYRISAVLHDLPANSSLQFSWLAPWETYQASREYLQNWDNFGMSTYVELSPNVALSPVNERLWNYLDTRIQKNNSHLSLLGMKDWRLRDRFVEGKATGGGRIEYVRMFLVIACIILLIACINFMNLATARSSKQAKEVGVRKVLGADKGGLALRFIGESMIVALLATTVAVGLIYACIPAFNGLVAKELSPALGQPAHIATLAAIVIVCGLVAGSYPSIYLSSFNPVSVLKGLRGKTGSVVMVRKSLVVVQFAVSIVLIICTVIVLQQIHYAKHRNLGFNKNNLLEIDVRGEMGKHFTAVREQLIASGKVEGVAMADHPTIYGGNNTNSLNWDGKEPGKDVRISYRIVSPGFFNTLGMKLAEGEDFKLNENGDTLTAVITESMAKLMGAGSAVGKTIYAGEMGYTTVKVKGVVKDYMYGSMFGQTSDPVMFLCNANYGNTYMYVRPKAGVHPQEALAGIESVVMKAAPGYPFTYRFVDDMFNNMFFNEMLVAKLARIFAGLAIFISCLGLFGLAAYTAEQRTREIGIRKVMGASAAGIATLLSRDFLRLVLIAAVAAFPLAWYLMSNWLKGYNYRVEISWWVFLAAGGGAMFIALITVTAHSLKAALINPIKSLRTE
ncbi:ABC transporter permease [Chitinophaga horti]|uniref:ABC transporter permease n=1 Tax=Chitinophaga horti TaxID=2920382 RepID=A0ABY6IXF9_9BACT|nr:ABC transporter permease [Chitinophaga horti]UYQ92074.1 ABC transporter permease [Chitinophaga horti]